MNKIILYVFSTICVLIFSFLSLFYYAFSGGVNTKEFTTGVLFILISLLSIIAIFLLKNYRLTAGKMFIFSGILALIIESTRIENPFYLFSESFVGMILVITPLSFILIGGIALSSSE